ncbi:MAG: hypothetical protein B6U94_06165 [Thermofilum sp. ex4484_79]|nr:MAG: hypothetical protein B6U94_06165 [Thermofilum sp. ex4484_79]
MLPAERLVCAFKGIKTEILPWFADLTYWYHSQLESSKLPEKYKGGEGRLQLYKDLGCGAHEELYGSVVEIKHKKVKFKRYTVEDSKTGTVEEVVYYTPLGELRGVRKYSRRSFSSAIIKHFVSTRKDLKILRYIYEDMTIKPSREAYERQDRLMKIWDGWGIVSSLPPRTPFARMLIEWAGVVNTFRLCYRYREDFEETIEVMERTDDPIYDAIMDAPADFVYFGDNISSDVVGTKFFLKYYSPYYKKRAEQLHKKNKMIYVHIDGRLKGVLEYVGETGVDCAQSLTPAPAGDVELEKFRELAGPNIVLWGGLPGIFFSNKYHISNLINMTKKIIELYSNDSRFIVGVADQVPPDGDISRVKLVTKILEKKHD